MAPNKWDDESDEDSTPPTSPAPVARRRFDDEESDDEVVDSWEAADDSEAEREKVRKAAEVKAKADAEAKANHKSKSERIAAKLAEKARRRQEEEDYESSDDDETEAEKRARLRRTEKDADLAHAEDLFGDLQVTNNRRTTSKPVTLTDPTDPSKSIDLSTLPIFSPMTKDQFSKLRDTLTPLLASNSKKAHYTLFMQEFTKQICKDLPGDQIKKIASGLTTLSNEKMKEEKLAEKGGKKTKAQKTKVVLHADRGVGSKTYADTSAYHGNDGLDEDDFM